MQKSTIERQKTRENNEKTSIGGINIDMHNNRKMWLINGPDLIGGSQSTDIHMDYMELATTISDATWTVDQACRSMAHIASQDHYQRLTKSAISGPGRERYAITIKSHRYIVLEQHHGVMPLHIYVCDPMNWTQWYFKYYFIIF